MSGISEKELEGLVDELLANAKDIKSRTKESYKEEWPRNYEKVYINDIGIADGQELVARMLVKRYKIKSRSNILDGPIDVKSFEEITGERMRV